MGKKSRKAGKQNRARSKSPKRQAKEEAKAAEAAEASRAETEEATVETSVEAEASAGTTPVPTGHATISTPEEEASQAGESEEVDVDELAEEQAEAAAKAETEADPEEEAEPEPEAAAEEEVEAAEESPVVEAASEPEPEPTTEEVPEPEPEPAEEEEEEPAPAPEEEPEPAAEASEQPAPTEEEAPASTEPKEEPEQFFEAKEEAEEPAVSVAPSIKVEEAPTQEAPELCSRSVTMASTRVTLEHLEIIHKHGDDTPDKAKAVADMHNELKAADGGLGELKSSQYAFTVNPLKEAIWFERKGQFAIGCQDDWTLCKVFMTTTKCVGALTNNLGLLDLEDLPNDESVFSLKKNGHKLTDPACNDAFHKTLEALYDLVEMDSTGAIDVAKRDELFQLVASFVRSGSRNCFESGTPGPKVTGLPAPPRFGFSDILKVFAKLKELGGKDLDSVDWDSMGISAEDGLAIWQSLSKRSKEGLPLSVWWKVLFLLVLEFEPHLLRMNLHLLDKAEVTSFQLFLDECMEPPDLPNNRFYKKMIQQVLSLQKICLLTTAPRRNKSPLTQLDKAFELGVDSVYNPKVVAAIMSAPLPTAKPEEPLASPVPAPAPALQPTSAPAPRASPLPAASPVPAAKTPGGALGGPPQLPSLAAAGVKDATAAATASPKTPYSTASRPKPVGKPPRSPSRGGGPRDIPIEIKTDLPGARTPSGDYSVSGSIIELNKEEGLLDLMHQAAAMCENITIEKRELILRERRMARNLKSAEENLRAVQAINAQLLTENSSQKEEIYQREDDINQLHMEAKHAAKELSILDTQNSQLLEQIEDLTRTIASLSADKAGLDQELQQSRENTAAVQAALDTANEEKAALQAEIVAEQAAKAKVDQDLAQMQQDKDTVELKLKDMQALLESANDEIDRLEEIQAEQQAREAELRRVAMEARRREFEVAEREAEESLRRAEELRKAKSAARRSRKL